MSRMLTYATPSRPAVGDLARRFGLGAEMIGGLLSERVASGLIGGRMEAGVIYTQAYLTRIKAQLRWVGLGTGWEQPRLGLPWWVLNGWLGLIPPPLMESTHALSSPPGAVPTGVHCAVRWLRFPCPPWCGS